MTLRIERHADAASFLGRARDWLMRAEAEHNLVLGIAHALIRGHGRFEPPLYFATVEQRGDIVGCAFRTPPYKIGLTRMPAEAITLLVDDVATVYDSLPAVLGPESETRAFATQWGRRRGVRAQAGMRQCIYQLERVVQPGPATPGRLRLAQRADVPLVTDWIQAFTREVTMPEIRAQDLAADRIAAKAMFLWVDGDPVSLAGWTGRSPNGIRVGPVYTPPAYRGRGYASAAVAAVSQRALDSGARLCFLYTDLANPISNAIYQRLGYEPVCDVVDWTFGPANVSGTALR